MSGGVFHQGLDYGTEVDNSHIVCDPERDEILIM